VCINNNVCAQTTKRAKAKVGIHMRERERLLYTLTGRK